MKRYPTTCKVDGQKVADYPRFMPQVDVDQAIDQDNVFPVGAVVDVIDLGGVIYAYKDAGEIRLTRGTRP